MRTPRRARALLALTLAGLSVLLGAGPATAHERAVAELVSPTEGAMVTGDAVEVVIRASGSGSPAEFELFIDDVPLDNNGQVAGVFTSLRLDRGKELRMLVTLDSDGAHILRLVPAPHERADPPITRTFTSSVGSDPSPSATASGSPSASTAPAAPAAPAGRREVGRGTVLVMVLGAGLLGCGIGAVVYARYVD